MALASISYIFRVFIEGAVTFIKGAVTFIGGVLTFIGGAITFVEGAVTFIGGVLTFVGGAVTFVSKESSAIGGRSFKAAKAGVADNIKGVNRRVLRQRLITYKLKSPLLLINSLISASSHSIGSSS